MQLLPIILSGGSGTRLWPVSREAMPKPFMKIAGGKSLLQMTWERACALPGVSHAAIVTNMAYSYKTAEELMDETGAKQISLLLEPVGRNTAPAVALAALWAQAKFGSDVCWSCLPPIKIDQQAEVNDAVVDAAASGLREGRLSCSALNRLGRIPDTGTSSGRANRGARARTRSRALSRSLASRKQRSICGPATSCGIAACFCFHRRVILAALEQHAPHVLQRRTCRASQRNELQ